MEQNVIYEDANTHSSKRIGYIREEESTKLSAKTHRRGKEYPQRQGLQQFYIFTIINLYIFAWLLFLNHYFWMSQFKDQDT